MKSIKARLKQWIQKKINNVNYLFADHLENRFAYICKAEYFTNCALNSNIPGISSEKYCDNEIIVSLTTYNRRLYEVYLVIESIMQQSMKPNRIVLWLADEMKNENIPQVLRNQQNRGLEIRYCKDIRSYKKLIPSLKAFPSAVIITIDDDHLYHFDLIENLVNAYKNNQKLIYCVKMHRMKLLHNKKPEKYKKWKMNYISSDISPLNFFTGVGGVLYPPHCFNEEIFNEKVFMDICQYADDIWFNAMALLNGVRVQKIFSHNINGNEHLKNMTSQYTSLSQTNLDKNMNDVQLKAVFDRYNLYDYLWK
jgi:hypothetical protein